MINKRGNFRLYHLYFFLFGAFYYWVLPPIILKSGIIEGMPGVSLLDNYCFERFDIHYFCVIFWLVFSFAFGSLLPLRFLRKKKLKIRYNNIYSKRDIVLFSLPFFLIGQYSIFKGRSNLFSGYSDDYNIEILGSIATANCIFLFLYLLLKQQQYNTKITYKHIKSKGSNYFLFTIIEFSIVLLGFGSRMYVLIPVISGFVFYLQHNNLNLKLIFISSIAVVGFIYIGLWRSGITINFEQMIYIGCAEPLFTWINAVSYFQFNDIQSFEFPYSFLSSFINMVPTFLLPDKLDLLYNAPIRADAPLGATSFVTSLLSNFGIIGSSIFLFLGGCILTFIRYNLRNNFGIVYYCCVCGIIPFQIFRDGFFILNKMIFFNFLILPFLILGFIKLLCRVLTSNSYQKIN